MAVTQILQYSLHASLLLTLNHVLHDFTLELHKYLHVDYTMICICITYQVTRQST
jgi:hypothetical protein